MEENSLAQKLGAEAFGTAVLVFIGAGSVPALFLARGGEGGAPFTGAELFGISTAFGFAVIAMVYAIGKVSGCNINPAVTVAMAVNKRMPWSHAVPYVIAQCVGATSAPSRSGACSRTRCPRRGRSRHVRERYRDRLGDAERRRRHRDPGLHRARQSSTSAAAPSCSPDS